MSERTEVRYFATCEDCQGSGQLKTGRCLECGGTGQVVERGPLPLPTLNVAELERLAIVAALEQTNGNRHRAVPILGISIRTLQRKIKQYGLPELPVSRPSSS